MTKQEQDDIAQMEYIDRWKKRKEEKKDKRRKIINKLLGRSKTDE